ncbi:SRPBCC family protein [Stenotrophobium rhamnosiphilum]|uniref:Polyketide cyclase n=1 Tax=Stenotrophobium rhamnosiphilum TaxID=2029166 RepID=A0A2T5MEZ2_9GAMM|nr:SRPBCC family protein [Stenotrophobium rhamnosiphilum]PTU31155.1 hypothetical protein CJD38_12775 [Stenotrophobium rhamnosiphilum]
MKSLKTFMISVIVFVVLLVGVGFTLPNSAHIERSVVVKAKPDVVFPLINNLHGFMRWSPWGKLDPHMTLTYGGPEEGVGARLSWSGNASVGTGSQEIIESVLNQRVKTTLQFGGYQHASTATFTLTPQGEGTKVAWAYDTAMGNDIISRYFGMALDGWIGNEYERGLATLAKLAESEPEANTTP